MAKIYVEILDPSRTKRTRAELPDNIEGERLIPALIQRLALPQIALDGRPINYQLGFKINDQEEKFDPKQTFASAGIANNSIIYLYPEIVDSVIPDIANNITPKEQPNQSDLQKIYELLQGVRAQIKETGLASTVKNIEDIQEQLKNKVEPYTIPIIIHEKEKEPILMVRADRLHIIEEYRDEQNKWFSIAWAFIGAALGVGINWITATPLQISTISVITFIIFCIVAILAMLTANNFQKRVERYKHIIIYESDFENRLKTDNL